MNVSFSSNLPKSKRCLVTGGAGFIGSHLLDLLLENGCHVRVLENFATGRKENIERHLNKDQFELLEGSVLDPKTVEAAIHEVEIVFHLACLGVRHSLIHPLENHRVNAEGTLRLLEACRKAKPHRFVYCSSSEVYGSAEYVPMDENHPTRPCTVYGSSKLAGECYARAYFSTYEMPVTIVRPFNTFGPRSHHEGDAGELIPKSIVRALSGNPLIIFGDGTNTRDFTFVTDIAAALALAGVLDGMIGGTFKIGSQFEISINSVAEKINAKVGNLSASISHMNPRPGDVKRLFGNPKLFSDLSGWQPQVSFDEGLEQTIEYFRRHRLGAEALFEQERGRNWESA